MSESPRQVARRVQRFRDKDRVNQLIDLAERIMELRSSNAVLGKRIADVNTGLPAQRTELAKTTAGQEHERLTRRLNEAKALTDQLAEREHEVGQLQDELATLSAVVLPALQAKAARNTTIATWALVLVTVALMGVTLFAAFIAAG